MAKKKKTEKKRARVYRVGYETNFGVGQRRFYLGRYGNPITDHIPARAMGRIIEATYNEVLREEDAGFSVREVIIE